MLFSTPNAPATRLLRVRPTLNAVSVAESVLQNDVSTCFSNLCLLGFLRQVFDKDDEAARIDFEHGARLGGVVAKREAIKLNPYAQLCNQMVTQAMQAHQSCTAAAEPPEKPSR